MNSFYMYRRGRICFDAMSSLRVLARKQGTSAAMNESKIVTRYIFNGGGSSNRQAYLQLVYSRHQSYSSIPLQCQYLDHFQRRWVATNTRDGKEKEKSKGNETDDGHSHYKDPTTECVTTRDEYGQQEQEQGKASNWMSGRFSKQTRNQINAWMTQGRSIPNLITFGRIFSTPLLCHWILSQEYQYAAAGCIIAGISDYLDGYIAKNYNQTTVLGTYLDPLADKILINSIAVSLAYVDILPPWCAALWLGRDALLVGMSYHTAAVGAADRGHAVIDPSKTPFQVKPTMISKVNTVFQFLTIAASLGVAATVTDIQTFQSTTIDLGMLGLGQWNPIEGACYLTCGTTILSGLSYLDGKSMKKLKEK